MPDLDLLIERIESKGTPTKVFFRDDDIGWGMHRLRPLCERFSRYKAPLDLALIPTAISRLMVAEIAAIVDDFEALIHLHQHGYEHVNHQRHGRKCEFGSDRGDNDQCRDIAAGKVRLENLFGDQVEPIFTPPWNRCISITGEVLHKQGFQVLSRMKSAAEPEIPGLCEIPVAIDWLKKKNGKCLRHSELLKYAERAFTENDVVGVMLHHEHMNDADLDRLDLFLEALAHCPSVTFQSIMQVAANSASDGLRAHG